MTNLSNLVVVEGNTDTEEVKLQLKGADGTVTELPATIRPRGLTPTTRQAIQRAGTILRKFDPENPDLDKLEKVDEFEQLITTAIVEQVESWDATWGPDDTPLPVTVEALTEIPIDYLVIILAAINEETTELPKDKPRPSSKRTNTAAKRRRKS